MTQAAFTFVFAGLSMDEVWVYRARHKEAIMMVFQHIFCLLESSLSGGERTAERRGVE